MKNKVKHPNVCALVQLKDARRHLTRHQYRTLRGLVYAGDAEGALKGLRKLLLLQGTNAIKTKERE